KNAILSSHADAIAATVAAGAAPIEFGSDQAWNGDPPRAAAPPWHGTYVPIDIFTEGARRCETATCRSFSPHRCWRSLANGSSACSDSKRCRRVQWSCVGRTSTPTCDVVELRA